MKLALVYSYNLYVLHETHLIKQGNVFEISLIYYFRYVSAHANGYAPHHGVIGGYDGGYSYHARAVIDGKWVPGKAGAYPNGLLVKAGIPYGGAEQRM